MLAYNAELFGGVIHNDVGFSASWGAFPVLTAYVAQTGRLALAPVLAASGPSRCPPPSGPSAPRPACCDGGPNG